MATLLGLLGFGAARPSLALFRPTAVWIAPAVVVSLTAAALVVLA